MKKKKTPPLIPVRQPSPSKHTLGFFFPLCINHPNEPFPKSFFQSRHGQGIRWRVEDLRRCVYYAVYVYTVYLSACGLMQPANLEQGSFVRNEQRWERFGNVVRKPKSRWNGSQRQVLTLPVISIEKLGPGHFYALEKPIALPSVP